MLDKEKFGIRAFRSAEEQAKIVQRWRDEYPLKDGTEGCPLDLDSICFCTRRLLVYQKDGEKPIGTVFFRGAKAGAVDGRPMEIILGVGDVKYMNKEALYAIKECVCDYIQNYVILLGDKPIDYVLNACAEGGRL